MTNPSATRAPLLLLAALALTASCATYRPATLAELPEQQRVRMRLTAEELGRNVLFASGQGLVSGRFVALQGDSAVFMLNTASAHRQVTLPAGAILELERRDPANARSMALAAALVGGVATLAYLGFEGEESGIPSNRDDPSDQLAPGLRFVIPISWE